MKVKKHFFFSNRLRGENHPQAKLTNKDVLQIRELYQQGFSTNVIARNFKVRVGQIKQWNGLLNNDLKIGQRLTIYSRNPTADSIVKATQPSSKKTTKKETYLVKSGDSLWSISNKLTGVSIQNLKEWNDIWDSQLKPGMNLIISN